MEDRELKVMESRVMEAMKDCPQGKQILRKLFPDVNKKEWEDITNECNVAVVSKIDYADGTTCGMIGPTLVLQFQGKTVMVIFRVLSPSIFEPFKLEDGRLYKKVRD